MYKNCHNEHYTIKAIDVPTTVEPPNNGHVGDEHFVHCLEVVPSDS